MSTVAHCLKSPIPVLIASVALLLLIGRTAYSQTGTDVPSLAPYDQFMTGLLSRTGIPGASLAVTRNGRLVFARGYGFADVETQTPVRPDSLFRIASLSKTITAAAVMHLVEQDKLSLDQSAFELLSDLPAPPGTREDPRLPSITIRHLLEHSGGWDKELTFDPLHTSPQISAALGVPAPVSTENIIRGMRSQPLQFTPGARHAYSNFGYAVLGRIIERVTGMSYEQYVRTRVLAPMGISAMRLGNTLVQGRLANEVTYYFTESGQSVYPDTASILPMPYGGRWALDTGDAAGGWLGSAIDYAKFLNAIDGRRGSRFLSPESIGAMTARPNLPEFLSSPAWYGLGMMTRPVGREANWWHTGGSDGNLAFYARLASGYSWVVLLNASPKEEALRGTLLNEIDRGLSDAFTKVTNWPASDQFADYPDRTAAEISAQPAIDTREGVVNAATLDRGVVSGSWLTVRGANLASTSRAWQSAELGVGQLPLELDGVSVNIDGRPAPVYSVAASSIQAQAPEGLSPGWVTVEVLRSGRSSGTVMAHVKRSAPGLFTSQIGGRTLVSALGSDGTPLGNAAQTPGARGARPSEVIALYGTGFVPTPAGTTEIPTHAIGDVEVHIGGRSAVVGFAGAVGPGLFQVNVLVPELADGFHPVRIAVNGIASTAAPDLVVSR